MNIALWIVQGVLAVMFLMAGMMKATKSKEELKEAAGENMAWVDSVSASNVRLIGILEVLCACASLNAGYRWQRVMGTDSYQRIEWIEPIERIAVVSS